jgi:hypothetical protein
MQNASVERWILVAGSIAVALAMAEAALRIVRPVPLAGIDHQPTIYVTDETNGYAYRPGSRGRLHRNFEIDSTVVINARGFHDRERAAGEPRPSLRVAATGDSFTAALQVPIPSTWTQVLERQLEEATGAPAEVVNLGLDGTGSDIHRNLLAAHLATNEVDVVVWFFDKNDFLDVQVKRVFRDLYAGFVLAYQNADQKQTIVDYVDESLPPFPVRWLYPRSLVVRSLVNATNRRNLLRSNFVTPRRAGIPDLEKHEIGVAQRMMETAFSEALELSNEHGFRLLIVPVPRKDDRRAATARTVLSAAVSSRLRDRLDVVDLTPAIREILQRERREFDAMFWRYDGHFSVLGNRVIGEALAPKVLGAGHPATP